MTELWKDDRHFYNRKADDLESLEQCADFLESLLHGLCGVRVDDDTGELVVCEQKQRVDTVRGLKLEIYSDEHPPPHFHVRTRNINASFVIEDCAPLAGHHKLKKYELNAIRLWHGESKHILVQVWNESRPSNCTVGPIPT